MYDTKFCPGCKQVLPKTEFHKSKNRYDGVSPHCKACRNKMSYRHYHDGNGKEQHQIGYIINREKRIKRMRDYGKNHKRESNPYNPIKAPAYRAVSQAILSGKLKRPEICESCRLELYTEAHHHKGYNKEHWLDVIWLCKLCHDKADHPEFSKLMEELSGEISTR